MYATLHNIIGMKKIIIPSILVLIGLCLIYLGLQKQFYKTISQETLVGIIRCARSLDKNYDFYLFYFPSAKNTKQGFLFFKLRGKEWTFEGEIIKWKRPLNLFGLKTVQRPLRIFDSEGTVYPLEIKSSKFIFGGIKFLPLKDTSFISGIRQVYYPKIKFGIFATNSGYLVRRIK